MYASATILAAILIRHMQANRSPRQQSLSNQHLLRCYDNLPKYLAADRQALETEAMDSIMWLFYPIAAGARRQDFWVFELFNLRCANLNVFCGLWPGLN